MKGWIAAVSAFAALLLLISACCALDPFVPQMQPKIDNHSVSPPDSKTWDQPFKYTGNFSFPYVVDLTLEVYDLSVGDWCPVESGNSTEIKNEKWQIVWENVTICSGTCSGTSRYRFKYNGSVLKYVDGTEIIYKGPKILEKRSNGGNGGTYYGSEMRYMNATVDPNWVSGAVRENETFNYSVIVNEGVTLILEIYNLSSKEWEDKGEGAKSKQKGMWSKWKHNWTVNLTLDANWQGISQYQFYPKDRDKSYESQIYYGPSMKSEEDPRIKWKEDIGVSDKRLKAPEIESRVDPGVGKWFEEFTYTADITHHDSAKMTVALFVYKPGSEKWKPVPWRGGRYNPIIYPSDYHKDIATVSWTVDGEEVFAEADAENNSMYYIWYWDGYNEYTNEGVGTSSYGPELLHNREPDVKALKPKPENGSTHTTYEYIFEVNDPDNDKVEGLLTVIDPLDGEHVIEGTYKDGYLSFTVGPSLGIFSKEKLDEYINNSGKKAFTSQYRLEYWDEGIIAKGKTEEEPKEGWFTGPNVTAVTVGHTKPKVKSPKGTYANEFVYRVVFNSSRDNTIKLNLTIYDPSNPNSTWYSGFSDLSIDADTEEPKSWTIKPDVFGPEDAGKTARYTIEWRDSYKNVDIIYGSGPYIERAVPLLSWDPPLVPVVSMVLVPLVVIGISLLSVISGVPVSSLLKRGFGNVRKKREEGTEKKKEGEKGTEEKKKEEAED